MKTTSISQITTATWLASLTSTETWVLPSESSARANMSIQAHLTSTQATRACSIDTTTWCASLTTIITTANTALHHCQSRSRAASHFYETTSLQTRANRWSKRATLSHWIRMTWQQVISHQCQLLIEASIHSTILASWIWATLTRLIHLIISHWNCRQIMTNNSDNCRSNTSLIHHSQTSYWDRELIKKYQFPFQAIILMVLKKQTFWYQIKMSWNKTKTYQTWNFHWIQTNSVPSVFLISLKKATNQRKLINNQQINHPCHLINALLMTMNSICWLIKNNNSWIQHLHWVSRKIHTHC